MSSKNHLNKKKVILCILVLFALLLIILLPKMRKKEVYRDISVLIDNELKDLTTTAFVNDKGTIYIDIEDVKKFFDDNLYYNEIEKQIILTGDCHVILMELNKTKAFVNNEEVTLNSPAYIDEISGIVFIPISDLNDIYNIETAYANKTNRVIIDSTKKEKTESRVEKKTSLRTRKGLFAKKIEKVLIGDIVSIIKDAGSYKQVRMSDGEIGFIKSNTLGEEKKIRENIEYTKPELKVYENYDNVTGVYGNVETDSTKLNVVNPVFFEINKDAMIVDKSMTKTAAYDVYTTWAENNGLKLMPSCINIDSVSNNLLTYSQRVGVINLLVKRVKDYGFVGINIDFDQIDDVNSFYRFLIELEPRFREQGLYVCVSINNKVDITKGRVQNIVDYVVEE